MTTMTATLPIDGKAVTAPGDHVKFFTMNRRDALPAAFALMGTQAAAKVVLRLGGGCKGMNADDKRDMLAFFGAACAGFRGIAFSGATRSVGQDGSLDPMVTDVPALLALQNEGCVGLGTLPKTETALRLVGQGELVLDEWGTRPNPGMAAVLLVQESADGKLGWNGDVATYFELMEQWVESGGFTAAGLVTWNGGAITEEEIFAAAARKWPVFLVKGSGRVTDEIVAKLEQQDAETIAKFPALGNVVIVSKDDPDALRAALVLHGFIS